MKKDSNNSLLLLLSAVCLLGVAYLLSDLPQLLLHNNLKKQTKKTIINSSIAKIDNVLSTKPHFNFFSYTSGFENPFRKRGNQKVAHVNSSTTTLNKPIRPKLLLKGILLKNNGLAIIEDERGQTYIRGTGESILDQQIVDIKADKVVLKDRKGNYELAVEEH